MICLWKLTIVEPNDNKLRRVGRKVWAEEHTRLPLQNLVGTPHPCLPRFMPLRDDLNRGNDFTPRLLSACSIAIFSADTARKHRLICHLVYVTEIMQLAFFLSRVSTLTRDIDIAVEIPTESPPPSAALNTGIQVGIKFSDFRPIGLSCYISQTVQDSAISYYIRRIGNRTKLQMIPVSMTLSDLYPDFKVMQLPRHIVCAVDSRSFFR